MKSNRYIVDAWGDKFEKCCGNCNWWRQSWSEDGDCICKKPDCPRNFSAHAKPCKYFVATEFPCFELVE